MEHMQNSLGGTAMESIQAIVLTPLPSSGQVTGAYSLVLLTPCDNPVRYTAPDLIGLEKIEVRG